MGTCPYRERCVYLHDPRLMSREAKTKTRRKNKEDIVIDSLFWPVLPSEVVNQKLDMNRQPHVIQRYNVPSPQNDQFRRHDQAVYSMWQHFVTACGLFSVQWGGGYSVQEDTLNFMTPSFLNKHSAHESRSSSPSAGHYDPVSKLFTPGLRSVHHEFPSHAPALVALLDEKETTNAFIHAQRLNVFVHLSAGNSVADLPPSSVPTRSPISISTAIRETPARGYHNNHINNGPSHGGYHHPQVCNPPAVVGYQQKTFQACTTYESLPDLNGPPPPVTYRDLPPTVVRPKAWSPPRGKSFLSEPSPREPTPESNNGCVYDDEDNELLDICGLLQTPLQTPRRSLAIGTPYLTLDPSSAFRRLTPVPNPSSLRRLESFPDIASPTTVCDVFRDSPCHHDLVVKKMQDFHEKKGEDDREGESGELDQQWESCRGQIEAFEQTIKSLRSSTKLGTISTPPRNFVPSGVGFSHDWGCSQGNGDLSSCVKNLFHELNDLEMDVTEMVTGDVGGKE